MKEIASQLSQLRMSLEEDCKNETAQEDDTPDLIRQVRLSLDDAIKRRSTLEVELSEKRRAKKKNRHVPYYVKADPDPLNSSLFGRKEYFLDRLPQMVSGHLRTTHNPNNAQSKRSSGSHFGGHEDDSIPKTKKSSHHSSYGVIPQPQEQEQAFAPRGLEHYSSGTITDIDLSLIIGPLERARTSLDTKSARSSTSEYSSKSEPDDVPESLSERREHYRRFFAAPQLKDCLNAAEDDFLADKLYDRLLEETRTVAAAEMQPGNENQKFRTELMVRAFWDNVRAELRDNDDADEGEHKKELSERT
jgi:hypothetical protein